MENKNKMILIAAIGALVIFIAATAVRCAVMEDTPKALDQPPVEPLIVQEQTPLQVPALAEGIEVVGINDEFISTIGNNAERLNTELATYIKAHHPSATRVLWGSEVYTDYKAGTVVTTFTLDDAARTTISVIYTKSDDSFKVS
jgi:hypothetical protein